MRNIMQNKGNKRLREVDRLLRANGWVRVSKNRHCKYRKDGVNGTLIIPIHNINWKNLYDNCRKYGINITSI